MVRVDPDNKERLIFLTNKAKMMNMWKKWWKGMDEAKNSPGFGIKKIWLSVSP